MDKVQDKNAIEDALVHFTGASLIGSHTLCGMTDIMRSRFEVVGKKVNCRECLAVQAHVLGRKA